MTMNNQINEVDDNQESIVSMFIESVYSFSVAGDDDAALDFIFLHINRIITNGDFALCRKILLEVDETKLTPTLLVGFLSITFPSRAFVSPERNIFFNNVYARLRIERGEALAARLLNKYNAR